ncbi:hypothetical protein BZA05DRAFT_402607 [Tricharina praecox]|uniref:uncharacterized protein n=1 Tax=Tricharina praecox TaxID=43433 RepID=UPI00221FCBA9|nr:uncharacterized protein BZA05DRAFT_402607 [Tricharina praecox]KAI5849218.1 hypothetical protein BZA05DRAFT_402607 [Tricharina praecox]
MPGSQTRTCGPQPVIVKDLEPEAPLILASPFISALVFENTASDARDHCANERNFLSWLRLSIYMCIVSIAIILSFQLKTEPSLVERRMALPLGLIFWALSLVCLGAGLCNYLKTIEKYSKRAAIVQSGAKTQMIFIIVSVVIVGACVIFITTNAQR